MLKAKVGVARGATCGAVILTAALDGATVPPVASAGADGQGIGLQHSAPVGYVKVCGDNQNGQAVCLAQSLRESLLAPSSQTARFVGRESQPMYQVESPATSPQSPSPGLRAYTRGASGCATVFARNRQAVRAKIPATAWRKLIATAAAHLTVRVTLTHHSATAFDRSGVFGQTNLIRVGGGWNLASAPPLPRFSGPRPPLILIYIPLSRIEQLPTMKEAT